jgi:hypothetical protein
MFYLYEKARTIAPGIGAGVLAARGPHSPMFDE